MRSPVDVMESGRERFGETFTLRMSRVGALVFVSDPGSIKRLFAADRDNRLRRAAPSCSSPCSVAARCFCSRVTSTCAAAGSLPPFHGERMRAYEAVMAEIADRELDSWPLRERFPLHPECRRSRSR